MRFEILKQRLIKRAMILGGIIGITAIMFLTLVAKKSSLEEELESLRDESINIVNEIATADEKNKQIVKSLSVYKNLRDDKLPKPEMGNISHRIRAARNLKEDLSQRYKLDLNSIDFTKIENISRRLKVKNVEIYSNNIVMEFDALTDEIVMSFCYSMLEEAPGYITIENITLNKIEDLTPEIIAKIKDESSPIPTLVKAKVTFKWRTIDDKEDVAK